ncbi:GIY-YIG nuclease family protein [Kingella kingae]|uniref:GIY-YIG nuclease family protein n=1 Tax=Kingella kingae TaxID=504 RepID=UPI00254D6888|nr:GIY-YIG nuclease family protein [Kingella kingae]MDK4529519.1 GIY-YIG nuclease family protein [Kingella kingae]MDK4580431.1 GIY-YIG nuclease family protein [Kingella kingae]
MWCVYLIWCANNSLYCGITNHVARRWQAHSLGKAARYTKMHRAVEMRVVACCLTRSAASQLEHALKQKTRAEKLAIWDSAKAQAAFNEQPNERAENEPFNRS